MDIGNWRTGLLIIQMFTKMSSVLLVKFSKYDLLTSSLLLSFGNVVTAVLVNVFIVTVSAQLQAFIYTIIKHIENTDPRWA